MSPGRTEMASRGSPQQASYPLTLNESVESNRCKYMSFLRTSYSLFCKTFYRLLGSEFPDQQLCHPLCLTDAPRLSITVLHHLQCADDQLKVSVAYQIHCPLKIFSSVMRSRFASSHSMNRSRKERSRFSDSVWS